MDDTFDKKIIGLEKEYWRAMQEMDVDAALRLTADPCIVAGAQGVSSIDRQTMARMMSGDTWKLHDYSMSDVAVRKVGDDVAVIGYKVTENLTVDGKPLTLEAADASTWVRQNGEWVCAMHTESILGDPFGRDRKASAGAAAAH
jgi:hypothetical protein